MSSTAKKYDGVGSPCEECKGNPVAFRCRYCRGRYCRQHILSHAFCVDPERDSLFKKYERN